MKGVSWLINLYLSIFRCHCVDVNSYKSLENVAKSTELNGCSKFTTGAIGLRRLNNPVVHTRKVPVTTGVKREERAALLVEMAHVATVAARWEFNTLRRGPAWQQRRDAKISHLSS